MSGLFHDTFFALFVRALLGPKYFSHLDEMDPPNVYRKTIIRKPSSETILTPVVEDHDDPLNARERGYGVYDEQEVPATQSAAMQSSVTIVALAGLPKTEKEASQSLLVTWYGPDDSEVRQGHQPIHITLLISCQEPNELVATQESMGHVSSLSPDIHRLHRLCGLHWRGERCRAAVSYQHCCRDSRAYNVRGRGWNWCVFLMCPVAPFVYI
jgi:hypothetical protein